MTYLAGPSRLWLSGHLGPIEPGEAFEHDFSDEGADGQHGPSRERALIAAGAITRIDPETTTQSPGVTLPDSTMTDLPGELRPHQE